MDNSLIRKRPSEEGYFAVISQPTKLVSKQVAKYKIKQRHNEEGRARTIAGNLFTQR